MIPPELPPFYYLHNFHQVLQWVQHASSDLLEPEHVQCGHRFGHASQPAQALLVRLLMRKGPVFRIDKLRYAEIENLEEAVQELAACELIETDPELDLETLFAVHTVPELRRLFSELPATGRKSDYLEWIGQTQGEQARPFTQWCADPGLHAPTLRLSPQVMHWAQRLQLLFFGNHYQDWSEFVLSDLGLYRYETVILDQSSRAFRHNEDVRLYEALSELRDAQDEADPDLWAQRFAAVQAVETDSDWLQRRKAKTLFQLGQQAERQHWWPLAEQAYVQTNWPGARYRQLRVLERQDKHQGAWPLFCQAWEQPENESETQKLLRMLPRLRRKLAVEAPPSSPSTKPTSRTQRSDLVLFDDGNRVESQVLAHWDSPLAPVFYVENALFPALLGLLSWDAIFAPLPGAFFHPYQACPADWGNPDFVSRRQNLFDQSLSVLDGADYKTVIWQRWQQKRGIQCPLLIWPALNESLIDQALHCIPAQHLQLVFKRILQDWRDNRSGLPDLVRFMPAQQSYELIEVKGPGDRLQDNQRRWLSYFEQHAIPARVCYVTRPESP
ncbi:VRR-NUC domain-containing protein [Alcaligenes phenolicus]|uniref:phosphodiesterase I n=1 Tax=Alcaligenes phenolicus TaxID=232846 RepID=A0ABV2BED6_9BURK